MSKKSFADNPALAFIGSAQPRQPEDPTESVAVPSPASSGEAPAAVKYHRLTLRLKPAHKSYLEQVSWQHRTSITQYIADLIAADMHANGGQP